MWPAGQRLFVRRKLECFAPLRRRCPAPTRIGKPAFASGAEEQQDGHAERQAGQPEHPDLGVGHLQRPLEHPPPGSGIEERQQAFEDQHQRDRAGEQEGHCYFFLAAAEASAAPAAPPEPRIALKKSELVSMTITSDFLLKLAR